MNRWFPPDLELPTRFTEEQLRRLEAQTEIAIRGQEKIVEDWINELVACYHVLFEQDKGA